MTVLGALGLVADRVMLSILLTGKLSPLMLSTFPLTLKVASVRLTLVKMPLLHRKKGFVVAAVAISVTNTADAINILRKFSGILMMLIRSFSMQIYKKNLFQLFSSVRNLQLSSSYDVNSSFFFRSDSREYLFRNARTGIM
jgi:hypothetical protein